MVSDSEIQFDFETYLLSFLFKVKTWPMGAKKRRH